MRCFFKVFYYYFDFCFPRVKSRKCTKNEKWITADIVNDKNEIQCLARSNRYSKNVNSNLTLKDKKTKLKKRVLDAKRNYYKTKISESQNVTKTTWALVNCEVGAKGTSESNPILNINGIETEDPKIISTHLNNYFINRVEYEILPNLESSKNNLVGSLPYTSKTFLPEPVTEQEIQKIIASFKNKFSSGYDDIPMPIIQFATEYLKTPLTHIINSSLISGIFPKELKVSKVKPHLKKGSKSFEACNYRPISILPSFSKIYERVMSLRFINYLESNNLIDREQHGFRSGKSVITACVELIESVIDSIDKGEHVIAVLMDIKGAFDSVVYQLLLHILELLGVRGRALAWFASYLTDRFQYVDISCLIDNIITNFPS